MLPNLISNSFVLEYSHGLHILDEFEWQDLVHCGDVLLEKLLPRASETEVRLCFRGDKHQTDKAQVLETAVNLYQSWSRRLDGKTGTYYLTIFTDI